MRRTPLARKPPREADYVVIGAGSAGAVVARRLAEAGHSVVVLEAGGSDLSPFVFLPAGLLWMPRKHYWTYETEPDPSRTGRRDMWGSGKIAGGSSSVNAMLWVRGHRADFDNWAARGAAGWDYESLLPLMKRAETWTGTPSPWRGTDGPQHVSPLRIRHATAKAFIEAAVESGYQYRDDPNGADSTGVGWAQVSQRGGLREGVGRSYLRPARRAGARLVTHALVQRVIFDGIRAVAVEYERNGVRQRVACRREVIVSAGAVGSPAVLQRSGIGDPEVLAAAGVPLLAKNIAVGANLQEHPTFSVGFRLNVPTLNQQMTPAGVVAGGVQFLLRRSGPATATLSHAIAYGRVDVHAPWPEFQLMFSPLATAPKSATDSFRKAKQDVRLSPEPIVNCHISLLHPRSTGHVRIRTSSAADLPSIDLSYFGTPQDLADATAAGRAARAIFESPAMRPLMVEETLPSRDVRTDEEWASYLARTSFNAAHWVGTVRMGAVDDDRAALDPALRVKGVQGVRVVDASVMPSLTSGNTNAPAILIGEKGSALILG